MAQRETERTIWLVRHGNRIDFVDPDWRRTAERPHDPPLSPDGLEQADYTGRRLQEEKVAHLFCSPFLRTIETAARMTQHLRLPIQVEHGLSELLLEEWFPKRPDWLPLSGLKDRFPDLDLNYQSVDAPNYPETMEGAKERAGRAARRLVERTTGNLLLVTHGGGVMGATAGFLGTEPETLKTGVCCLVCIKGRPGAWRLVADGSDRSHLAGMGSHDRVQAQWFKK